MAKLTYRNANNTKKDHTMLNFDNLMGTAKKNSSYASLTLDENNNISLDLLADGITCVVMQRKTGSWVEIKRFEREVYFTGGHWSDIDIDNALNG